MRSIAYCYFWIEIFLVLLSPCRSLLVRQRRFQYLRSIFVTSTTIVGSIWHEILPTSTWRNFRKLVPIYIERCLTLRLKLVRSITMDEHLLTNKAFEKLVLYWLWLRKTSNVTSSFYWMWFRMELTAIQIESAKMWRIYKNIVSILLQWIVFENNNIYVDTANT